MEKARQWEEGGKAYLRTKSARRRSLVSTIATKTRTAKARARRAGRAGRTGGEVMGRGWSRAVRSTYTRVVLRTSPRETNARVANWVALHLVDGHLGSMAVDKLDETAALARRNLDVGDLSEALEEGTELILGDVA